MERDFQQNLVSEKLPEVRNVARKVLVNNSDKIPWDIVDHGPNHADNVASSVDEVNDVLEETSIVKTQLGRNLTPKERFEDQAAGYLHDVGRVLGEKSHAQRGAEFASSEKDLPLDKEEREKVSRLIELHSDGATRKKYGTDDLTELAEKGVISKNEAIQATSLRIADALEAGKNRAERNSQDQVRSDVTRRIESSRSPEEAKSKLSHWIGHSGFDQPKLSTEDGAVKLRVRLDDEVLQSNGGDVAFRIKDLVRDISSTLVDKKYRLDLVGNKRQNVENWLNKYGDIMAEELRGVDTRIGAKD